MCEEYEIQKKLLLKSLEIPDNDEHNLPSDTNVSYESASKANSDRVTSSSEVNSPFLHTDQMASDDPVICPYCNKKYHKPRVLDCLHSMCEDCIIAQLDGRNQKNSLLKFVELEQENVGARQTPPGVIRCPICNQETHIGNDPMFVNLMLLDFIRIREHGLNEIDYDGRICQACKGEEKAIANCRQCCSDLCLKCVQAHHDMKMFDGHKVVIFSEVNKPEELETGPKKLAICEKHRADFEQICPSCDELLCLQCAIEHIDHNCAPLNDAVYKWCKKNILNLATQAESKGKTTLEARSAIPERTELLKESYEKSRTKIEESFEFYAQTLNELKVDALAALDKSREEKEEYLNSLYQKIDMQTTRLQDALIYTNNLLEKGTIVDLCMNKKKIWQQLKLLMHSMPDVNTEVDLDFDILPMEDFKKKLEAITGNVRCRVTGIPMETKNSLQTNLPKKIEGIGNEMDSIFGRNQSFVSGWGSPNMIVGHQQNQGPGTIGMERRMNRNSNGTSYLSGDSGIYSSASDVTLSSPVASQLNTSLETFGGMNRLAINESFGNAYHHSQSLRCQLEGNQQIDTANLFSDISESKIWGVTTPNNLFGNFENVTSQKPRELINSRFGISGFPPLSNDQPAIRSRSSLCTTPSLEIFASVPGIFQNNYGASHGTSRSHYGSNNPQTLEMQVYTTFNSILKNPQDTLNTPQGLALGLDNEIAIADTNNHRCLIMDIQGNLLRFIGSSGTEEGHVYYPKKIVAAIRNRDCRFIVLDRGNNQQFNRLQLFKNSGEYICRLVVPCPIDQVSIMAVNKENGQLIIIDNKNNVHAFGFENFNQLTLVRQFSISGNVHEASDIGVFKGHYYITDYKLHGVVIYTFEGKIVHRFGGLDVTPYPVGIDFSKTGDILVGDSHGNHFHVVVFNQQGQHHYRWLQQKVSRCTGLKIASDGHIVTLSRQNSSVIVFNTLYIPSI